MPTLFPENNQPRRAFHQTLHEFGHANISVLYLKTTYSPSDNKLTEIDSRLYDELRSI